MLTTHLLVISAIVFCYWLWRQPEIQEMIDRVCAPISRKLYNDEYRDEMIRLCIKDYFSMIERINESTSLAEVESWYWEIDIFFNGYVNQVPDQMLKDHSDRLYEACHKKRTELTSPKIVYDNQQISLS